MVSRRALLAPLCAVLVACGTNVDLGGSADDGAPHETDAALACPGFAAPDTPAKCFAGTKKELQPNGCYGGYYCRLSDVDCQPPRDACSEAGAHDF